MFLKNSLVGQSRSFPTACPIIRDTHAGHKASRARGRTGGRPQKMDKKQIAMAKAMMSDASISIDAICHTFKISRPHALPLLPFTF